ncbi:MAG: protein kinase [Planctomycetes bacterium]|nr:protein kinase [Planctomycetota bacterium]
MTNQKDLDDDKRPPISTRSISSITTLNEILDVLLGVAESIRERHTANLLCGPINQSEIVFFDSSRKWGLSPLLPGVELDSDIIQFPSDAPWFDSFGRLELETLPRDIVKAQREVDKANLTINVKMVDCFEVGQLACRLIADCSVIDYLQSPKVLSRIPEDLRPFIDSALGFDSNHRFENIDGLIAKLENIRKSRILPDLEGNSSTSECPDLLQATIALPTEPTSLPFNKIGQFQIRRLIGSGGMGDVYEGYDESLKRKVAVKVLPPELGRHESFVQRFYSEAASVAKLIHPNIIQIFFIGEDQGHHFFAMEFVEGKSLADQLALSPLSVSESLSVAEQILEGLSAAHKVGLVHRDVKPGNILVEQETNRYLLLDFGLVKSLGDDNGPTHSGMVLGTMDYISPEQGSGRAVDARSDLYSLGVVLYEVISGKLPFYSDSPTGMIFQHVYEHPLPLAELVPHVPPELSAIVSKLMAKDPSHRYDDAAAVLADVKAFQNGEPLPSQAGQLLQNDPLCFSRPVPQANVSNSNTAIISAPRFDDFDEDLEILNRRSPNLIERIVERWHDWFEAKSPILAERLQSTQLQIDRAILKLEKHRDQLAMLDHDAQNLLKQFKREVRAHQKSGKPTDPEDDLIREELERAFQDQEEQAEAIQSQLNQVNTRLAQIRTERDVLIARMRTAEARTNGGVKQRKLTSQAMLLVVLCCTLLVMFLYRVELGIPILVQVEKPTPAKIDPRRRAPATIGASQKWPIESGKEITIPLAENIRAMDVVVTQYIDRPAYSIYAVLDNNSVVKYYFRKGLDYVNQTGFARLSVWVKTLAVSPREKYLAIAAADNSIRLYEVRTSGTEEYRKLDGHLKPPDRLSFSRDGSNLISMCAEDGTVRIWDIQSGAEIQRFEISKFFARLMSANGNLSRVLIGNQGFDRNSVTIWNSLESRKERVLPTEGMTTALALSGDARTALSLTENQIHVWNAMTGKKIRVFGKGSHYAAFAIRVQRALTLEKSTLNLWGTGTGELIESRQVKSPSQIGTKMLLSENGEVGIVATGDKKLNIYHLPPIALPDELLHQFFADTAIHSLDLSSDGVWIAGAGEGKIFMWNTKHPPASFTMESPVTISTVAFSPDGAYLAYGTGQKNAKTNHVGVRQLNDISQTERIIKKYKDWRKLTGFEDRISSVAWNQNGKLLLASAQDGQIKSWDPRQDKILSSIRLDQPIQRLTRFDQSPLSLLMTGTNQIELWDYEKPSQAKEFIQTGFTGVDSAISADNNLIAVASRTGQIHLFSRNNKSQIGLLESDYDIVNDLCFIPNKNLLAAGYQSGVVRLWDFRQSKMVKEYTSTNSPVMALNVSPNVRHVTAASLNGNINIWKLP